MFLKKRKYRLFTSESVAPGHPDKVCDQISDAVLDAILKQNPEARVACEVFITDQLLLIAGEVHNAKLEAQAYEKIARKKLAAIGYDDPQWGLDLTTLKVIVKMHEQSPDILQGVEQKKHIIGAGDQGMMFGYACSNGKIDTNFMPLPIVLAHELIKTAWNKQKTGVFLDAGIDMKAQVTIDYSDPKNLRIDTILMSIQHRADYQAKRFKKFIQTEIMQAVAKQFNLNTDFKILINPTGKFIIGGPKADTGLTGRKIMVDTYGGSACHGGGAFSGKDLSKVDRSGSYFARYIAKNIVAAKLARKCEVQIAFAIGEPQPVSIYVDTFNTHHKTLTDSKITEIISQEFDFEVKAIIAFLTTKNYTFTDLAVFGHCGRSDLNLPWEQTDRICDLRKYLNS